MKTPSSCSHSSLIWVKRKGNLSFGSIAKDARGSASNDHFVSQTTAKYSISFTIIGRGCKVRRSLGNEIINKSGQKDDRCSIKKITTTKWCSMTCPVHDALRRKNAAQNIN